MNLMTEMTFLLADVGNSDIGRTKTYVTVSENETPIGSFTVSVSTTYSKAKDPDNHMTKIKLHIDNKDTLMKLGAFLQIT
jgi:hypothetical protein